MGCPRGWLPKRGSAARTAVVRARAPGGAQPEQSRRPDMSVADLLAEHGSPLWLANLDVVRDRQRAFAAAWRAEWPDVDIAYSHKANGLPAILRTLAENGIGHQVACEGE